MKQLFTSRDPATARLATSLAALAPTDLPLLLEGETGTGKSWAAARIHRLGRPGLPYVVVDCGAVPETLFPAEVFGHVPGAFTDASRSRAGALEQAGPGTLVFDRLDVLPASAQVSLLRVLEERLFTPLGGSTRRALRARVVSTVGAGVRDTVESRILRSDLFHRIAGYHAVLPPLRERRGDILPFARAFVRRQVRRLGRPLRLGADAEDVLLTYPWPGNFRELGTALTRACLGSAQETLTADALGLAGSRERFAEAAAVPGRTLRDMVRSFALLVLAQEGGNVSRAARSLGISRRTLIRWRQGR